jgi:asparagine synthase (glutamine-hydrolysing)
VAQIAQKLAYQYDEPFADSSMIPTYYVCELARQFVTVALAGDGGDEIFGGYSRYQRSEQDPQSGGWLPFPLRKRIAQFGKHYYPRRGGRAEELFTRMEGNRVAHYESAMMTFSRTELAALLRPEVYCGPSDAVAHAIGQYDGQNYLAAMQMTDMEHYLPDDILVKVDRVSMLHSLEVRAPLLDQPLMDFAGILPPEWVYKKRIFKDALKGHVPDGMLTRPKSGFAVPLDAWFSDSYHDYLREILLQPNARITAYIAPTTLQKLFSSNRGYIGYQFWSLLMLELWLQYYGQ